MPISNTSLHSSLEAALVRHRVPGASIAIFRQGELTTAAAGVTNMSTGVEVTPDTLIHIGSITKLFTATLVMQLVDEGQVDLDERVVRYLPDLRLKDHQALQNISVKMLLNHTSGIDGEVLPDHGHDEETIEKGVARFAELGQKHSPGSEFSYCNAATVVAGYLAQRLRRRGWYQLVRERIFEPLKLERAAALPEEALLHRACVGHHLNRESNKLIRTSFAFLPLSFAPCGTTLMMSAEDLITFARAHMALGVGPDGTRILSERSAKAMQQVTVNNRGKGYAYDLDMGLGWMIYEDGLLHHAGGGPGVVAVLYAHPERDWATAILTNADHGLHLINEFAEPLLKEWGKMQPFGMDHIELPEAPPKIVSGNYVGVYEDMFIRYRVSLAPEGLTLSRQMKLSFYDNISLDETQPTHLIPLGDEKFLLKSSGEGDGMPSGFRALAFRKPNTEGRMQYLGYGGRLFPRVL